MSSLETAKNRILEVSGNHWLDAISYEQSIDQLTEDVDLAIIATNADVRRMVIEELLAKVDVKYLLLEKVVFQSVEDFQEMLLLLNKKQIKAWVNFPRRIASFYRALKSSMCSNNKIFLRLEEGSLGGIIQSGVHFLDLLTFLTGENHLAIDVSGLGTVINKSKRGDYIDLTGVLRAKTVNGSEATIIEYQENRAPDIISIFSRAERFLISEVLGRAFCAKENNDWKWKEVQFSMPYQSEITHLAVQQIFDTGKSDLTTLEESFSLHKPMLKAFNEHLTRITGKKSTRCPIT